METSKFLVEKEGDSGVKIRSPTSGILAPFLRPMYTWHKVELRRTLLLG